MSNTISFDAYDEYLAKKKGATRVDTTRDYDLSTAGENILKGLIPGNTTSLVKGIEKATGKDLSGLRKAAAVADFVPAKLDAGFLGAAEGITDFLAGGATQLVGQKEAAKWIYEHSWSRDLSGSDVVDAEIGNESKGYQLASDLISGVGNVGFQVAIGTLIGGALAAPVANGAISQAGARAISFAPLFASASGAGTAENIAKTGELGWRENVGGLLKGGVEVLTEVVSPTGKIVDRAINGKSAGSIFRYLSKHAVAKNIIVDFASEAGEEMASYAGGWFIENKLKISDEAFSARDMVYQGVLGGITGALFSAPSDISLVRAAKSAGADVYAKGETAVRDKINEGLIEVGALKERGNNSDNVKLAEAALAKLTTDENLSQTTKEYYLGLAEQMVLKQNLSDQYNALAKELVAKAKADPATAQSMADAFNALVNEAGGEGKYTAADFTNENSEAARIYVVAQMANNWLSRSYAQTAMDDILRRKAPLYQGTAEQKNAIRSMEDGSTVAFRVGDNAYAVVTKRAGTDTYSVGFTTPGQVESGGDMLMNHDLTFAKVSNLLAKPRTERKIDIGIVLQADKRAKDEAKKTSAEAKTAESKPAEDQKKTEEKPKTEAKAKTAEKKETKAEEKTEEKQKTETKKTEKKATVKEGSVTETVKKKDSAKVKKVYAELAERGTEYGGISQSDLKRLKSGGSKSAFEQYVADTVDQIPSKVFATGKVSLFEFANGFARLRNDIEAGKRPSYIEVLDEAFNPHSDFSITPEWYNEMFHPDLVKSKPIELTAEQFREEAQRHSVSSNEGFDFVEINGNTYDAATVLDRLEMVDYFDGNPNPKFRIGKTDGNLYIDSTTECYVVKKKADFEPNFSIGTGDKTSYSPSTKETTKAEQTAKTESKEKVKPEDLSTVEKRLTSAFGIDASEFTKEEWTKARECVPNIDGLTRREQARVLTLVRTAQANGINEDYYKGLARLSSVYGFGVVFEDIDVAGFYSRKNGMVVINPKNLDETFGHEIKHTFDQVIKDGNAEFREDLSAKVKKIVGASVFEKARAQYKADYEKLRARDGSVAEMSDAELDAEASANVVGKYLSNMTLLKKIAATDYKLGRGLLAAIRRMKDKWTSAKAFAKENNSTTFAEYRKMTRIENLLMKELGYNKAVNAKNGRLIEFTDGNGTVSYNVKTYREKSVIEDGVRKSGREILEARLKKQGYSDSDVAQFLNRLDAVADEMERLAGRFPILNKWNNVELTYKDNQLIFSALVRNGEYEINFDFSTVCKHREAFTKVLNKIVEIGRGGELNLTPKKIAQINAILKEEGFETACKMCFVEGKRNGIKNWANTFVNGRDDKKGWNYYVRQVYGDDVEYADFGIGDLSDEEVLKISNMLEQDLAKVAEIEQEIQARYDAAKNAPKPKPVKENINEMMFKLIKSNKQYAFLLKPENLYGSKGVTQLNRMFPEVYSILNRSYGQGAPKITLEATPYGNEFQELAKSKGAKALADETFHLGGARLQSFSDYQMIRFLDYCQLIANGASIGAAMQCYTKEIDMVHLFGLTGMKINMSLVPTLDDSGRGDYAGLKKNEDGSWDYAIATESIQPYDYVDDKGVTRHGAFWYQNQEGYKENCGTILIGVSKYQILKAMADPNIRMIIPYHKSGLSGEMAELLGIATTDDKGNVINKFTDYEEKNLQHTRRADGSAVSKDFDFYEAYIRLKGDAKRACFEYLQWCEEHGYMPKFYDATPKTEGFVYIKDAPPDYEYAFKSKDGKSRLAMNENYYKLIEDFSCYDGDGYAHQQRAVDLVLPDDWTEVVYRGLDEAQNVDNKLSEKIGSIIDAVFEAKESESNKEVWRRSTDLEAQKKKPGFTKPSDTSLSPAPVTPETDSRYLELAKEPKKNDSELRRLVKDAAEKAGFQSPMLYHGTRGFGFTKVKTTGVEKGAEWSPFFMTDNLITAMTYSESDDVRQVVSGKNVPSKSLRDLRNEATSLLGLGENNVTTGFIGSRKEGERYAKTLSSIMDEETKQALLSGKQGAFAYDIFAGKDSKFVFVPFENGFTIEDYVNNGGNYEFYVNTNGFLVVDAKHNSWSDIPSEWGSKTRTIAENAKKAGYTGVIIKNVWDDGGHRTHLYDEELDIESTVYIAFDPKSQVKSADPVTYDDSGNIIPLSERFNPQNDDIRYSPAPSGSGRIVIQASQSRPTGREKLTNLKGELSRSNFRAALESLQVIAVNAQQGVENQLVRAGMTKREAAAFSQLARSGRSHAINAICYKLADMTGKIRSEGLIPILEPFLATKGEVYPAVDKDGNTVQSTAKGGELAGKRYSEFSDYYAMLHAIDRAAVGKNPYSSMTVAQMKQIVAEYEQKNPDFKAAAEKLSAFNSAMLDIEVQAGIISQETADLWRKQYPHYVPMYTQDSNAVGGKPVRGARNMEVRRDNAAATESDHRVSDPLRNYIDQVQRRIRAAKLNILLNEVYNSADGVNSETVDGKTVWSVRYLEAGKDGKEHFVELTGFKTRKAAQLEYLKHQGNRINDRVIRGDVDAVEAKDLREREQAYLENPESENDPAEMFRKFKRGKNTVNEVSFYKDGKRVTMAVTDRIYTGLSDLGGIHSSILDSWTVKAVKKVNDTFKKLVTNWNPFFAVKNIARDLQDGTLQSRFGMGEFLNMYRKNAEMMATGKYNDMWEEFLANGGLESSLYSDEFGTFTKGGKSGLEQATGVVGQFQHIKNFNTLTEALPRFTEYCLTRKHGGSVQTALLNAADVTVNFGRSGTLGRILNTTVSPFLNPAIQGLDRVVRLFTEDGIKNNKALASLLLKAVLLAIVPMALGNAMYGDDDEYKDMKDSVKENNYLFKIGDTWLKLPRGRVVSTIAGLYNRSAKQLTGQDTDWGDYGKNVLDQITPAQNVARHIFSPFMDVANNKTWYGTKIESEALQNYAVNQRYDENTSRISVWIGQLTSHFGLSPKEVNYLIDQYTGVVGDILLPTTTPAGTKGVVSYNFTVDPNTSSNLSNRFYDLYNKTMYKANDGDVEAYYLKKRLDETKSAASELFKQIKTINASSELSNKEKVKQASAIRATINQLYKTALDDRRLYEQNIKDALAIENSYAVEKITAQSAKRYGLDSNAVGKYALTFGGDFAKQFNTEAQANDYKADASKKTVYAEANRLTYGAEYALREYNSNVYEKAQKLNELGISYDEYYNYYMTARYYSGADKKKKILAYLNASDLSKSEIALMMYYSGYSAYADEAKKAIKASSLSAERKKELLAGFTD